MNILNRIITYCPLLLICCVPLTAAGAEKKEIIHDDEYYAYEAQLEPDNKCSKLARERVGLLRSVEDIERRIGKGHTRFERDGMLYHTKCNRMVLRIRMIEKQMKDLNCPSNSK